MHVSLRGIAPATAFAFGALALGVQPLAAQRMSIAPTIGVYAPTADLYKAAQGEQIDVAKQEVSIALGGRLGFWFSPRLGIEATGEYAPSSLKFAADEQFTEDANVFTGSGRLTFFVVPRTSPLWFAVNGGVGYVRRSGAAYEQFESSERSDVTGTAGASVGFRLGQVLGLQVSLEDYIYKADAAEAVAAVEPGLEARTQHDVHVNVGVSLFGFGSGMN